MEENRGFMEEGIVASAQAKFDHRLFARIFGALFLYSAIALLNTGLDLAGKFVNDAKSYVWVPTQAAAVRIDTALTSDSTVTGYYQVRKTSVSYEYEVGAEKVTGVLVYLGEPGALQAHQIGETKTVYYDPSSPQSIRDDVGITLRAPVAFFLLAFISSLLLYVAFALLTREKPEDALQSDHRFWVKIGLLWAILCTGVLLHTTGVV